MQAIRNTYIVLVTLVCFLSPMSFAAQQVNKSAYQIPWSSLNADIDGELHDELWLNALTISLDIVNNPWDNLPAPVKTTAKIIENGDYLYIAFIANDPNPEKIIAALADRDSRWGDDLVGIKLDTANNRRLNYSFLVNPFGVQHDQIYNEMTGNSSNAWDGIWQSFGKITASGYQVEMAIPFHILNFESSNHKKTWAFELIRLYPRDSNLRISHVALNRDNACWLCQYPEVIGFEKAQTKKNLTLTPTIVASKNEKRDVYSLDDNWHSDNDIEAGLDVRWGISSDTLVNLTLNPDFSTVESDAAQLSVNKTFSLFYEEKRAFFLENADYFTSNFDLIYTRNIADPDYGAKITGTSGKHTYGFFITNDRQTNFTSPGNISSALQSIDEESHNSAFKYRYDFSADFSVGLINTMRISDNYHNIVTGLDSKYRFDDSNSILAQVVSANTNMSTFYDAQQDRQYHDTALKLELIHQSEYWQLTAQHQNIGKDFQAGLGFMPKADYRQEAVTIKRTFYAEDEQAFWSDANINMKGHIEHDLAGKLLEQNFSASAGFHGPLLSYFEVTLTQAEKLGFNKEQLELSEDIKFEEKRFSENQTELYAFIQPRNNFYGEASYITGDKIDYINNALGDYQEIWGHVMVNLTDHLELDVDYSYSELDIENSNSYVEQAANVTISYQFDVRSYLKLNLRYTDIVQTESANAKLLLEDYSFKETNKGLASQLIYSYKINPQTLFFLGYSDNRFQDNDLKAFRQEERTFFSKISYAWMAN